MRLGRRRLEQRQLGRFWRLGRGGLGGGASGARTLAAWGAVLRVVRRAAARALGRLKEAAVVEEAMTEEATVEEGGSSGGSDGSGGLG